MNCGQVNVVNKTVFPEVTNTMIKIEKGSVGRDAKLLRSENKLRGIEVRELPMRVMI